jgi:type I restriction enzyme S subunit
MRELIIDEKDYEEIKYVLDRWLKGTNAVVYAFGSRVKGTTKKYADLDLALDMNGSKIPNEIMNRIISGMEDSWANIKVDVLDLNDISEKFKQNIESDLLKLFVVQ